MELGLVGELEVDQELSLAWLLKTDYAVETRYPDEPAGVSREDSVEAIELARKARRYVVDHLPQDLTPPEPTK